jgi:cytoskeletal protein RodZ
VATQLRRRKAADPAFEHDSPPPPRLEVAYERPASVAQTLRSAREARGWDVEHVAAATRIRRVHVLALEEGRYEALPGHTYVVGFLRQCAAALDLDADALIARYKEELDGEIRQPAYSFPKPVPEGGVPTGAIVLVAALLAAAAYGGWYWLSTTDRTVAEVVGPLPERLQGLVAGLAGGAAVPPAPIDQAPLLPGMQTSAAPGPATVDEVRVPPPRLAEAAAAPPSVPAPAASAPAAPAPAASPPPAAAAPARAPAPPAAAPSAPVAPPVVMAAPVAPPPVPQSPAVAGAPVPLGASDPVRVSADTDGEGEVAPLTVEPISGPAAAEEAARAVAAAVEPRLPPPPRPLDIALPPAPAVPPPAAAAGTVAALPAAPPAAPAAAAAVRAFGAAEGESRIAVVASSDSWIQVRNGAGDLVFTRVLRPGEVYRVPDQPGLRMVTGNAGGIAVVLDGAQLPPMGAQGQVLRDIALDPQRLAARAAAAR